MQDGRRKKINRICQVHAEKVTSGKPAHKTNFRDKPTPCRYYQKGTCGQSLYHVNNREKYLHICAMCFAQIRANQTHSEEDCRSKHEKKNDKNK